MVCTYTNILTWMEDFMAYMHANIFLGSNLCTMTQKISMFGPLSNFAQKHGSIHRSLSSKGGGHRSARTLRFCLYNISGLAGLKYYLTIILVLRSRVATLSLYWEVYKCFEFLSFCFLQKIWIQIWLITWWKWPLRWWESLFSWKRQEMCSYWTKF